MVMAGSSMYLVKEVSSMSVVLAHLVVRVKERSVKLITASTTAHLRKHKHSSQHRQANSEHLV